MDRIRARATHRFTFRPQAFDQRVAAVASPQFNSTLHSNDVEMRDMEGSREDAVMASVNDSDVEMEDVSTQPVELNNNKTAAAPWCRLCAILAASRNATDGAHPPGVLHNNSNVAGTNVATMGRRL